MLRAVEHRVPDSYGIDKPLTTGHSRSTQNQEFKFRRPHQPTHTHTQIRVQITTPARHSGLDPTAVFESLDIHPEIKNASEGLFRDGHYTQSILEAYKALNNYVKSRSGKTELDGKSPMSTVFSRDSPILALNSLRSTSDKDEQEGFMLLYMGAMVGIRNPKAHETVRQGDPFKTLEYLALASLLARRVDEARKLQD